MITKYLAQSLNLPWMGGQSKTINGPLDASTFGLYGGENFTLGTFVSRAMDIIFIFAGVGLLLMLLSGGFTFLTSAGDTKKLEQGKQTLTNALLGFIIVFASFWLVQGLGIIFGLQAVKDIFG